MVAAAAAMTAEVSLEDLRAAVSTVVAVAAMAAVAVAAAMPVERAVEAAERVGAARSRLEAQVEWVVEAMAAARAGWSVVGATEAERKADCMAA